uniref:Uncharacterized protein n=1 Tax=Tanacetum cinerariifolium TaxID=118510 RepID=A0A6L2MXP8_TANCI|nr:hypothetical protein [Tanacetum cinerariifolium]
MGDFPSKDLILNEKIEEDEANDVKAQELMKRFTIKKHIYEIVAPERIQFSTLTVREEQEKGAQIVHSDLEQGRSYGLLQTRGVEIEHAGSQQQGLQDISEEFIYAEKICLRNFSCVKQQLGNA